VETGPQPVAEHLRVRRPLRRLGTRLISTSGVSLPGSAVTAVRFARYVLADSIDHRSLESYLTLTTHNHDGPPRRGGILPHPGQTKPDIHDLMIDGSLRF
jgi:hypothetical protein